MNDLTALTEITEYEKKVLIEAFQILDGIKRDVSPFYKDIQDDKAMENLRFASSSLEVFLNSIGVSHNELFLGKMNNEGRYAFISKDNLDKSNECLKKLRNLLAEIYDCMIKTYPDNPFSEQNEMGRLYWSVIREYELARFYFSDENIAECEVLLEKMQTEFLRLQRRYL